MATNESLERAIAEVTAPGKPFETETIRVNGVDFIGFVNAPTNLRDLYRSGLRHDVDFYVYEEERYSFNDAWKIAASVANKLLALGIEPGDRVGVSLRNYPEWIFAFMGITSMGSVAVAMNAWWSAEEMEYGIEDSGLKLLFVDQERLERVGPLAKKLGIELVTVRCQPTSYPTWEAFIAGSSDAMPEIEISPADDATLLYTSGSTAHPKGVLSTHRSICNALLGWEAAGAVGYQLTVNENPALLQRLTSGETPRPTNPPSTILSVPLFHVTGLVVQLLSSFRHGRKLVGMYKWDVERALQIIEAERITSFNGVPTMSYELVKSASLGKYDVSSLQSAGGGGAAMAPEQAKEIDKKIAKGASGTGWGMTETQGLATSIGGPAFTLRPKSCGRALPPLVKVKAVDEEGNELPPFETGELCIWGIQNFSGYWNNPEATRETLVDGWVHTGDVGHLDDEGYVFITDRMKDIVIRGGENIGCQEVEAVLYEHPSVAEASVFGIPDERLGETVAAVVCLEPNADLSDDDLRAFASERLAQFKVPSRIWIGHERLPRTASEKIFKRQIREETLKKLELETNE
ncbi:MAG: class I adenylate-forming enzyme family protein [Gammaproteobacteria bacterium]|nr:class I adenylate-forming enzyme family protein [Gammaproteobacteria bacterium]